MSEITIDLKRFKQGDFPPVSVLSGRPATQLATFRFERRGALSKLFWDSEYAGSMLRDFVEGFLPVADGETLPAEIQASNDRSTVRLTGVHPTFIDAIQNPSD